VCLCLTVTRRLHERALGRRTEEGDNGSGDF
jgi:hypothetical protein